MIRAIFIVFLLAIGAKAAFAVADLAERMNAQRTNTMIGVRA